MAEYLSEEDMNTGEYISRDEALKAMQYCCENCDNYNGAMCRACDNADEMDIICDIPAADVQHVRRGKWIEKSEEYYRLWQDSGRSWDDMPYFVTGLKFACPCCFNQYDVNAEGIEEWDFCPKCGADMRGEDNAESKR